MAIAHELKICFGEIYENANFICPITSLADFKLDFKHELLVTEREDHMSIIRVCSFNRN